MTSSTDLAAETVSDCQRWNNKLIKPTDREANLTHLGFAPYVTGGER